MSEIDYLLPICVPGNAAEIRAIHKQLSLDYISAVGQAQESLERIAELEQQLAELREELKNSWRPIETAPKDREVLLQSAHGSVANGCWCATGWAWPYIHKEPQYWRELLP